MRLVLLRTNMPGHVYALMLLILVCSCSRLAVHAQNNVGWQKKQVDIGYLIDASSSIWEPDFRKLLSFVASLVSDMDIGPNATRVGVGVFSNRHQLYIPIDNTFSKDQLMREILKAPYLAGDGFISRGLLGLREQTLPRSRVRSNVPLIAVLFTDGESRYKQLTADNATLIKEGGISLFTVGITPSAKRTSELFDIASDPKQEFNYYAESFSHLTNLRTQLSSRMSQVQKHQEKGTCGQNSKADTMFVFNEAAFGSKDSENIKLFIAAVIDNFSMNSGSMRTSVISKLCPKEDIEFGQYITKEEFTAGLKNNNGPGVSDLLKKVLHCLDSGSARPDARKRTVLFLQASEAKRTDTLLLGSKIKYSGVEAFVIVIGKNYDIGFINSLASQPENVINPNSAEDLVKQEWVNTFNSKFCAGL
ncbi:hypothetical protein BsWGS_01877 [Bradybaena similaris]